MSDSEITNGELGRMLLEMKQHDKEYREKEDSRLTRMEEKIESVNSSLGQVNVKIAVANGRTGDNEKAIKLLGDAFAKYAETMDSYRSDRRVVYAIGGLIILCMGGLTLFARYWVEDVASRIVQDSLEEYDFETLER